MSKHDPLEEAKIVAEKSEKKPWFKKKKKKKEDPAELLEVEEAPDEVELDDLASDAPPLPSLGSEDAESSETTQEEKPASRPKEKPGKASLSGPRRYRIMKDKVAGWRGNVTTFRAGVIINESGFGGPDGIKRLIDSGVELELVE